MASGTPVTVRLRPAARVPESWGIQMVGLLAKRVALVVAALLVTFGLPLVALQAPASAAPGDTTQRTIGVAISDIDCAIACDGQGIEGPGQGPPDWYAKVFINGVEQRQDAPDDIAHFRPHVPWQFNVKVPLTQASTFATIQLWDRDSGFGGSDDLTDSSPVGGKKNLDFTINTYQRTVTGDVSGNVGSSICTNGNGEDGDGAASVCFTASNGDNDGDGLMDEWETNGIDFDGNGTIDLPLNQAPFNANPDRKDVYMEIDYMACGSTCVAGDPASHRPLDASVNDVINAFKTAPVPNPDGSQGIDLHAVVDDSMPEVPGILFQTNGPGTNDDFNDLKNGNPANACNTGGYFGTAADRGNTNCANILGAKRAIEQYVIFGHSFAENLQSSGNSELNALGGNDLMVTLGSFETNGTGIAAAGGQEAAEAGTLMHEFGHNLSLQHGGNQPNNCKPNYLSIMSYSLQFPNIDAARPLDYSNQALNPLDETGLPSGIGGPANRNFVYGQLGNSVVLPANSTNVNWDGSNGNKADVNFLSGTSGCGASPKDTNLTGFNDWQNIVLDHSRSTQAQDGASRTTPDNEITVQEVIAMTPKADLNANKSVDKPIAQPGDILNYSVVAKNNGPGRAYDVKTTDTLPDGSVQTRNVGELADGAQNTQAFTYGIACSATDGSHIVNNASVSGTNVAGSDDPNLSDNTSSATTTVSAPVVSLTTTSSPSVNPGASISNNITYQNTGSAAANNVVITQTVPAGVTYTTALDQGTGPKPTTVVNNSDGTTTLTWNVGTVAASSAAVTINYTARPSLLTIGGTSLQFKTTLSYGNGNGCSYSAPNATSTTSVVDPVPTRNPIQQSQWKKLTSTLTPDVLAQIQATDARFDGADGSVANGVLTQKEVDAVLAAPNTPPRSILAELLCTYINMAQHRINASTKVDSPNDRQNGVKNVRDVVLFAQGVIVSNPPNATLNNASQLLQEVNLGNSERY